MAMGPNYERPLVETPMDWRWKKRSLVMPRVRGRGGNFLMTRRLTN